MKTLLFGLMLLILGLSYARAEVQIRIVSLQGFGKEEDARFRKIAAKTQVIINSPEFKKLVEGWYWKKQNRFVDTTDTPKQVFAKITSADWKLEYRLEKLGIWSKTIGYTLPDVSWIAFNSRKFWTLTDADISNNICHEYGGHKFGRYDHSFEWNIDRQYSVPYGVGWICGHLYK